MTSKSVTFTAARELRGRQATVYFLLLVALLAASNLFVAWCIDALRTHGVASSLLQSPRAESAVQQRILAHTLTLFGGCFMLLKILRFHFPGPLLQCGLVEIGGVRVRPSWMAGALSLGICLALLIRGYLAPTFGVNGEAEGSSLPNFVITNEFLAILFLANVVVLGPVFEEVMFRGVLYRGFSTSLGLPGAAILTSVLFALLHPAILRVGSLIETGALLVIGLGLFLVRWLSGSLLPAICMHAGYNLGVVLLVS